MSSQFFDELARQFFGDDKQGEIANKQENFPLSSTYFGLLRALSAAFKKEVLLIVLGSLILALITLSTTRIYGYFFSRLSEEAQMRQGALFVALAFFLLSMAAFSYAHELFIKCLNARVLLFALPSLWSHIFSLPSKLTQKIAPGELAQSILAYEAAYGILIKSSLAIFLSFTTLVALLAYMAYCSSLLAFLYSGICILFTSLKVFSLPQHLALISAQMAEEGAISSLLNDFLLQIDKIRAANAENEVFKKWLRKLINKKSYTEKSVRLEIISGLLDSLTPAVLLIVFYLVLYFLTSAASPDHLLQFIICAGQFAGVFESLAAEVFSIILFLPGLSKMRVIIKEKLEGNENFRPDIKLNGALAFSRVSFQNVETGQFILEDINFEVKPGQFIAFMGHSGAGKSSLFKLLLGLERPTSGVIQMNGEAIDNFDLKQIRRHFGVVLQTSNLLPGTLYSNISANSNLTLEEAWQLAKQVGLDEDINSMPMKMHTHISDNAAESLSGGQKQKILIARALAAKPKILLLDEATSALDGPSEAKIFHYLESLAITRIVIAHRSSTLAKADQIYVLNKGKIATAGTYDQLNGRS